MGAHESFRLTNAGLDVSVQYSRQTVEKVFRPLALEIAADFGTASQRSRLPGTHRPRSDHTETYRPTSDDPSARRARYLIAVSGPPGSGKSTVSGLLQHLLAEKGIPTLILPLDGFHMKNEELKRRKIRVGDQVLSLYERKGAKESYDVEMLLRSIERLRGGDSFYWPVYSRALHEPVEEGELIRDRECVCIIEGNYLFLNMDPWNRLCPHLDKRIFILGRRSLMKKRLIARKMLGGFTKREAKTHYLRSDALNIDEVLERSEGYDIVLRQRGRYGFKLYRAAKEGCFTRSHA